MKISYQWGNLAPVARMTAQPVAGREPLAVALSSKGTLDHAGDALRYEWRLHPGDRVLATTAEANVALEAIGNYVVELVVSDGQGGAASASAPLTVGNTRPEVAFATPQDGDFFTPGKPLKFEVRVRDREDGKSESEDECSRRR